MSAPDNDASNVDPAAVPAPVAAPGQPVEQAKAARSGGWLDIGMSAMVSALVCLVGGIIIEHRVDAKVEQAILARPDLAVVDDIGLVRLAIANGADRFKPAEVTAEIERIVAGAGLEKTILVSRSMVMYSPPEARIEVAQPTPTAVLQRSEGSR